MSLSDFWLNYLAVYTSCPLGCPVQLDTWLTPVPSAQQSCYTVSCLHSAYGMFMLPASPQPLCFENALLLFPAYIQSLIVLPEAHCLHLVLSHRHPSPESLQWPPDWLLVSKGIFKSLFKGKLRVSLLSKTCQCRKEGIREYGMSKCCRPSLPTTVKNSGQSFKEK